jgi:hypothetical protein
MSCYGQVLGILSFGDCGGKSESLLETNILNEAVSKTIQQASTTTGNTTILAQNQNISIVGGPHAFCCTDFKAGQAADAQIQYSTTAINNLVGQISQTFQNNIDAALTASQANKKGLLAGADTSKMSATIKNAIKNYFETESDQNSIVETLNTTIGTQSQNLQLICPNLAEILSLPAEARKSFSGLPKTGCQINRDFRLNLAATTCVKNVLESIQLQTAMAEIASTLETTQKNKGEGLSDLWGIFIIIGVVIIVGIIAFVIWTNTKGGQQVLNQGGNFMGSFKGITPPKSNIRTLTDYIPHF